MLSEKYSGLSREELLEAAARLGSDFEKFSGSCSQCTAAALREILDFDDVVVKVATSSCGGQAGVSSGCCGGIIGGTIVLDYYLGRPAEMLSATGTKPQSLETLASAMEVTDSSTGTDLFSVHRSRPVFSVDLSTFRILTTGKLSLMQEHTTIRQNA
ncbi:MAG: C-GCAxxG-C-C family (seleno)protein [Acidobacteriota bacterium]